MPVLNFGMLMGWPSPMTAVLQSPDGPAPEPISDEVISWMGSITFFPPIFCGILVGNLADKFGRKFGTLLTSLMLVRSFLLLWSRPLFQISWGVTLFSLRPWALLTSRAVAGLACAGCYVVTPLYLKEVASDDVRGALGSLFILFQNMGYLVVYIAGDMISFDAVMWLCTAVPLVHMLVFLAMPETPAFLVKTGKREVRSGQISYTVNTPAHTNHMIEKVERFLENMLF
ncbi:Solute carrier family 2, facilitated glucose transporter member 8 [Eumeta japonica]|uniref:Solute carrier family 2, facilitated glucose transporter member 8 n=1 Tax=Eumeta variegata TaxID=151549 RepID=A0A4C1V4N9_EUMVA|nr:Solute carrier family 2, facilitated glucose transporter member 8 [Eumeta japonica]